MKLQHKNNSKLKTLLLKNRRHLNTERISSRRKKMHRRITKKRQIQSFCREHLSDFISFTTTIVLALVILFSGYTILAKTGSSFLEHNDSVTPLSSSNRTPYVFYSQSDDDLQLYPWNYVSSSMAFREYFGSNLMASDLFNITTLYNNLRYYFYKLIPSEKKKFITDNDLSLSDIMDYKNIEEILKVKDSLNDYIYFYSKNININENIYALSFTFNSNCDILSFQCKELNDSSTYTSECMNKAKSYLKSYLNEEKDNDIYTEIIKNSGSKYSSGSFQIVETKDELIAILLDSNTVLHFDPVNQIINGFNKSE